MVEKDVVEEDVVEEDVVEEDVVEEVGEDTAGGVPPSGHVAGTRGRSSRSMSVIERVRSSSGRTARSSSR